MFHPNISDRQTPHLGMTCLVRGQQWSGSSRIEPQEMSSSSKQASLRTALVRMLHARAISHPDNVVEVIGIPNEDPVLYAVKPQWGARVAVAHALTGVLAKMFYPWSSQWILDQQAAQAVIRAAKLGQQVTCAPHATTPLRVPSFPKEEEDKWG